MRAISNLFSFFIHLVYQAQWRSQLDNWFVEGEGHFGIVVFKDQQNNRFQKKLIVQNVNMNGVFSQYVVPIVLKGWPGSRVKSLVYINMSSYLLYFLLLNFAAPFLTNARALCLDVFLTMASMNEKPFIQIIRNLQIFLQREKKRRANAEKAQHTKVLWEKKYKEYINDEDSQ